VLERRKSCFATAPAAIIPAAAAIIPASAALVLLLGFCGCATAPLAEADVAQMTPDGANSPMFTVEIKPESGSVQQFDRPLTGEVWLQDVVTQSGAPKRFRRMNIEVQRRSANGQWAKMKAEVDRRTKKITIETDYAIHPGDRIVIVQDTSTAIDDVLGPFLGALRGGR